ncbi:MAG: dynamin family protein [Paenibacillus sp.]|uniref:dynamin family protein n=1 Tax=Paenibacillus sp. TaxID=58172 RepID=UPI0029006D6E|nr:dynamin family protein [Paenibacillus sp.]MDU2239225.1 dynamin family protein [Paenibacillus sp.]
MAQVFFKYNPYKLESFITYNDKSISEDSKLYPFLNERLQVWMDRLVPILKEECNDDAIHIRFHGTFLDYQDLYGTVMETDEDVSFTIEHIPAEESTDKFRELTQLFDEMLDGPFDDLKDEQIQENFKKALGSEFEVSVIATMSSGKSTLINAMLGQEFVPAKNEACTATITRIRDTDGMTGFTAVCLDKDKNVLLEEQYVDLEMMKQFNENEGISYIEVNGDIPFIHTRKANLIMVDTPGPNNSRNSDHRDHTYRIIKNEAKPMVLYVLNATQLATDDDNNLLRSVAEAMSVGGKQSKDRFIFAVNKIDQYDTERSDSIDDALKNIREYLSQYGIENPNVFPISAELAKVIRLYQRGVALTRKQEKTLADYDLFNDMPQLHLTQYAKLPEARKKEIEDRARQARQHGNVYEEALIHTGVPAIEEAINEYLEKYAVTAKVKNAVDTFRKKVEEKRMLDQLLKEIEHNHGEQEKLNERMKHVETQLSEGKAMEKFKEKIQSLSFDAKNSRIKDLRKKIELTLKGKSSEKMTVNEVEAAISKLIRSIHNLQSDVTTELEKLVNEELRNDAERLLGEYTSYIQSLLQDNDLSVGRYSGESRKFVLGDLPDGDDLIQAYKKTEKEKVGEEWVKNENKKFYKPWTWFQKSGEYKPIYEDREYVNGEMVFDEYLKPVRGEFYENLDYAEQQLKEESKKLKAFFLAELNKLEQVIKKKVVELKTLTRDSRALESRINEDRQKMAWLNSFIMKLDSILEI